MKFLPLQESYIALDDENRTQFVRSYRTRRDEIMSSHARALSLTKRTTTRKGKGTKATPTFNLSGDDLNTLASLGLTLDDIAKMKRKRK